MKKTTRTCALNTMINHSTEHSNQHTKVRNSIKGIYTGKEITKLSLFSDTKKSTQKFSRKKPLKINK